MPLLFILGIDHLRIGSLQVREQSQRLAQRVLQIVIHVQNEPPLGMAAAFQNSRVLAEIPCQLHQCHFRRESLQQQTRAVARTIGAAVIDEHQLPAAGKLQAPECVQQSRQRATRVKQGHHKAGERSFSRHGSSGSNSHAFQ